VAMTRPATTPASLATTLPVATAPSGTMASVVMSPASPGPRRELAPVPASDRLEAARGHVNTRLWFPPGRSPGSRSGDGHPDSVRQDARVSSPRLRSCCGSRTRRRAGPSRMASSVRAGEADTVTTTRPSPHQAAEAGNHCRIDLGAGPGSGASARQAPRRRVRRRRRHSLAEHQPSSSELLARRLAP
jgi:hypothetical protein